jgi:hypothetical protein
MLNLPKSFEGSENAWSSLARKEISWIDNLNALEIQMGPGLWNALFLAKRSGKLHGGLENIGSILERELKGLTKLGMGHSEGSAGRMSKLLFVTSDGSPRFLRQLSQLMERHGFRVQLCRVNEPAESIGKKLYNKEIPVRAMMAGEKSFVAKCLEAILDQEKRMVPGVD